MIWVPVALAHPGADDRLEARLAQVEQECAPAVWLEQALAWSDEGRADDAFAALQRARGCGADTADLALVRGLLLAPTRPAEALAELDAALRARPAHQGARAARARLLHRLGRTEDALADLAALGGSATPDDRLARVRWLVEVGRPEEALAVVDDGPAVPALVVEAVRIEVGLGRPEAALGRLDALPDTPYWQARRTELAP